MFINWDNWGWGAICVVVWIASTMNWLIVTSALHSCDTIPSSTHNSSQSHTFDFSISKLFLPPSIHFHYFHLSLYYSSHSYSRLLLRWKINYQCTQGSISTTTNSSKFGYICFEFEACLDLMMKKMKKLWRK